MLVTSLLGEFLYEAEGTRKLLQCIPDSALTWKPAPKSWTTAELASHIAEIYNWYPPTFNEDIFDMAGYSYDKGDITTAANILAKFEANLEKAKAAVEAATEESLQKKWKMVYGEKILMPERKRIEVIRGFLMSHLYHHRGEMIVYLRATGNKIPGLYGPIGDDEL